MAQNWSPHEESSDTIIGPERSQDLAQVDATRRGCRCREHARPATDPLRSALRSDDQHLLSLEADKLALQRNVARLGEDYRHGCGPL